MTDQIMPTGRKSAPPSTSLWRHRDFLLLWSGGATSDLGSAISTLVMPLLAVQTLGATTMQVALLGLARRLPFVLLALPVGVLIDRLRRLRPLMIWSELAAMLATGAIPVIAAFTGHVTLWELAAAITVTACSRVTFAVADQSYLPALLPASQLTSGNAKLRAAETASDALGPAFGATLATVIGAARTIAADALSYAISALSLLLIRTPEPERQPSTTKQVTFRAAMGEGLRYVLATPALRAIAATTATANLGILMVTSLEVVYLVRTLHAHPTVVGLVLGAGAAGGFTGSLLAPRLSQLLGSARVMLVTLLGAAPLALLMPLAGPGWGLVLYAIGWAAFNAAGAIYNTGQVTYRQTTCPPAMRGRMHASIRWIIWSTTPIGALLAGALGTWIGLRPTLWIATSVLSIAGLWLLASPLRTMRDIPVGDSVL